MVAHDWLTARWDCITARAPRHVSSNLGPLDQPQLLSLWQHVKSLVMDTVVALWMWSGSGLVMKWWRRRYL